MDSVLSLLTVVLGLVVIAWLCGPADRRGRPARDQPGGATDTYTPRIDSRREWDDEWTNCADGSDVGSCRPRCRLAGRDFHGPTRVGLIVDMGLVRPMQRSVLDAPSRQGARRAESGRPRD